MDIIFQFLWVNTNTIVGMKLLNLTVRLCLTLLKKKKKVPNCIPKWLYHFEFLPAVNGTSSCCISLPAFDVISVLDFSHFNRWTSWLYHTVVLVAIPIVTYDIEQLFICLFATCISSLVRCLFRLLPTFQLDCLISDCRILKVLCMFWIQVLHQICVLEKFCPSLWLPFSFS